MITYDEAKRLSNLQKHGIDFTVAAEVFAGFTITQEDTRGTYDEPRFVTLGLAERRCRGSAYATRQQ